MVGVALTVVAFSFTVAAAMRQLRLSALELVLRRDQQHQPTNLRSGASVVLAHCDAAAPQESPQTVAACKGITRRAFRRHRAVVVRAIGTPLFCASARRADSEQAELLPLSSATLLSANKKRASSEASPDGASLW
jgi:hypothetical protein